MSDTETAPGVERLAPPELGGPRPLGPHPVRTRRRELDVLRGVAILLVLQHHSQLSPIWHSGRLQPIALSLWRFAWSGVDLFFVLSGFLVGGLLLDELCRTGTLDARRFLVRRAFKIWPSYFVLLAWLCVEASRMHPGDGLRAVMPNLLHLQNYLGTPRIPTWSLAVEEHFYLVLPFVLRALVVPELRGGRARFPVFFVAVATLCLGLRTRLAVQGVYDGPQILFPTHLRMDSLLFGVLLAWARHLRPQWLAFSRHRLLLLLLGSGLVSPMFFVPASSGPFVATVGLTLLYLGCGAMLLAAVAPRPTPAPAPHRVARGIAAVGRVSYPMYLWFYDVRRALHILGVPNLPPGWLRVHDHPGPIEQAGWWLLAQLLYVAATYTAGVLAAAVVERPLLALRDRWFPSTAAAV